MNKDILILIFVKLEIHDLKNLRLACKKFKEIVDDKIFWLNKILYTYPNIKLLNYKNFKDYYFELVSFFKEKNMYYLSAIAQDLEREDLLSIIPKKAERICIYDTKGNIKDFFYINPSKNVLEGKYVTYYSDGKIKEFANYNKGIQYGIYYSNNGDGTINEVGFFKNNKKHGLWEYHTDGAVEIRCCYKDGKLHGKYTSFIYGEYFEIIHYYENKQHGKYLRYHPENIIGIEGNYINGVKDGAWKYYNSSGEFDYEINFSLLLK